MFQLLTPSLSLEVAQVLCLALLCLRRPCPRCPPLPRLLRRRPDGRMSALFGRAPNRGSSATTRTCCLHLHLHLRLTRALRCFPGSISSRTSSGSRQRAAPGTPRAIAGEILRPSHSPPPGSWQTQQQPRSVVVAVSCGRCRFASRAEPPPTAAATTAAAAATNAAAAHSAFAAVIAASLH